MRSPFVRRREYNAVVRGAQLLGAELQAETADHDKTIKMLNMLAINVFDFEDLQNQVAVWANRNFPDEVPHQPLLGVGEEVGELMHAHLKGEQGLRHSAEEIQAKKIDAVGDIVVYLAHYCELEGISLQTAVTTTWDEVSSRERDKWPGSNAEEIDGASLHSSHSTVATTVAH